MKSKNSGAGFRQKNSGIDKDKVLTMSSVGRPKGRGGKGDKPRSSRGKRTWSKLLAAAALAYGFVIIMSFGEQFMQLRSINRNIDQVQQKIHYMQQKNKELTLEIKRLQSDAYVERIAREKLGLVKPGETVLLQAEVGKGRPLQKSNKVDDTE